MSQTDIPTELQNNNKIRLLEPYKGAMKHHQMECLVCGHQWQATPSSKRQTYKKYGVGGCPNCKKQREQEYNEQKRQNNLQKLYQRGIIVLDQGYDGRRETEQYNKIKVKNINCGHEFFASPTNLLVNNVYCAICGPSKRAQILTQTSKNRSKLWQETASQWSVYKSKVTSLTRKNYNNYKEQINPNNLPRGKAGEPGAYHLDHIVPIRFCFENNIPAEICADPTNLQMLHWNDNVGSRNHIKGAIPPLFYNYIDSDTKVQRYSKLIQQQVFPNSDLFVKVCDVVVSVYDKQSNHAVVIIPIDQTYANTKTVNYIIKQFNQGNVNYSIIFEDEIEQRYNLVLNKLKHYSKQNRLPRIHGRECYVEQITTKQKSTFLNSNHIQGNDASQINYGAFYNNQLVAVMTFCKPRVALGYKQHNRNINQGMWELSRFTTDINYRIPGIASKLLKQFERDNQWTEIYSYADRRWSTGNVYETLGFELQKINKPDYFYVVDGQRKHRWNYRKDQIKAWLPNYQTSLTEYQNMYNAGYWRVWDGGTLKYTKTSD